MSESLFPTRVRYSDRQFLQAADLQADQAYHRQARWRHNLALHSWGVLAGLEVSVTGADSTTAVAVTAGMALDGYGRELVILANRPLERQFLDANQSYDVWLVYGEEPEPPPKTAPRGGCATTATAARVRESPILRVTKTADRRSASPSRPDGVPVGDLDFGPERPAPPPDRAWPVFLARLDFREDAEGEARWLPDTTERRYAGLVAERIAAPRPPDDVNGKAQARTVLVNGSDPDEPDLRFAVTSTAATAPFVAVRTGSDNSARIELRSDRVLVAGDMTLRDGAALQFAANPVTAADNDPHAERLVGSDHWRVYHHFSPPATDKPSAAPTDKPPPGPNFFDELRITMPSVPAGANRVVIGFFGEKGKFEPVLAVLDNRSVEVYGTLKVTGEIVGRQAKLPADTTTGGGGPNAAVMKRQVEQYLNAGGALPAVIDPIFAAKPGGPEAAAVALAADGALSDDQLKPFVEMLWTGPRIRVISDRVFDPTQKRAGDLVPSLIAPYTAADDALTAFADELWKDEARLGALVDALTKRAPPTPVREKIAEKLAAWVATTAPEIAVGQLTANNKDEVVINGLLIGGRFTRNLERVGAKLAANSTQARVQGLLKGIGTTTPAASAEATLFALVAELIDGTWATSPAVVGKDALAVAFGDKLKELDIYTDPPKDDELPVDARLRAFFHYVKKQVVLDAGTGGPVDDRARKFMRLRNAIEVLGKNITTLPPT